MRVRRLAVGLLLLTVGAVGAAAYAGKLPSLAKRSEGDPIALVPNGAYLMFSASTSTFLESQLYRDVKASIEDEVERLPNRALAERTLARAQDCGYRVEDVDRITGGLGANDQSVFIVTGNDIGSEKRLQCLADDDKDSEPVVRNGRKAWVVQDVEGNPETIVYFLPDDRIVVVDPIWEPFVLDRLDGKGIPASDGSLRGVYAEVNPEHDVWFAAVLPDETPLQVDLSGLVSEVIGGVRLSDGFELEIAAAFADERQARRTLEQAQLYLNVARASASTIGVPNGVVERAELELSTNKLRARIDATAEELKALKQVATNLRKLAEASEALEQSRKRGRQRSVARTGTTNAAQAGLELTPGEFIARAEGQRCLVTKYWLGTSGITYRDCSLSIEQTDDQRPRIAFEVSGLRDQRMVRCSGPTAGGGYPLAIYPIECELLFESLKKKGCVAESIQATVSPQGDDVVFELAYSVGGSNPECTDPEQAHWRVEAMLSSEQETKTSN